MPLTRSQLLMGNSTQGVVLTNQVQGVKSGGDGVLISTSGVISFNAATATGVMRLNNTGAFNQYVWPAAPPNVIGLLVSNSSGALSWSPSTVPTDTAFLTYSPTAIEKISWSLAPKYGLGLDFDSDTGIIKGVTKTGTSLTIPSAGPGLNEAVLGSLFWDYASEKLLIYSGTSVDPGDLEWREINQSISDITEQLLTGSYNLFVNPEIGTDTYVPGEVIPPTVPPTSYQQLTCGYFPQKPFKTIARAALEVARIQNGPGYDPLKYDRIVIHCSAGEHIVDNGLGSSTVTAWPSGTDPTDEQLRDMNNDTYGGIILPRGVSVIGEDLRKTIIRPTFVPPKTGDIEADRAAIFRITGGGFFFNFTFKDKDGYLESHHLLDCFSFVSDVDLVDYYAKVQTIFSQATPDVPSNPGETEIVAPKPFPPPTILTDGVIGSSPYIFNCSVRSAFGLCGINADGAGVTGLKSMVTAQFTGVSLQRDLSCWQRYNVISKSWANDIPNYSSYVSLSPNNLRMDPTRRSFHIRAINDAFIQEVSVFAIGQGIHHWVHSGGEVSITNSNSSFGGAASLAQGYKGIAFPQDSGWNTSYINVASDLSDQAINVSKIFIGSIDPSTLPGDTTLTLTQALEASALDSTTPTVLAQRGYTFKYDSYLWVENANGKDFRSELTASAWVSSLPNKINIQSAMVNEVGQFPDSLANKKIYVRRILDTRSYNNRLYSLILQNTAVGVRSPVRDYVIQTTPGSGSVGAYFDAASTLTVVKSTRLPKIDPIITASQIVPGRANANNEWDSNSLYRPGDTVRFENKHFTCIAKNFNKNPNNEVFWNESFVHMPSSYNAYDFFSNVAPVIVFDNDTDGFEITTNCGYNFTVAPTSWVTDPDLQRQYTSTTDYKGVFQFLLGIGFTEAETEEILVPRPLSGRQLDPSVSSDMLNYIPSGAAVGLNNWPLELRRPSTLRMFGHSWEWAGYLNYTKALPDYQGELSLQNQFTYYFTNELGGRVYASGYNQEGYLVTAAGLTDLATGDTTSSADLGNSNLGLEIPTYYESLTVGTLRINDLVTGSPAFNTEFYSNLYDSGLGVDIVYPEGETSVDSQTPYFKLAVPTLSGPPGVGIEFDKAKDGSMYWDKDIGALFVRYNDGSKSQWVQTTPAGNSAPAIGSGVVFPTAGQAAAQTPINTFSPTSTPLVNTYNPITYIYNSARGVWLADVSSSIDISLLPALP